jgi:hypothetical protein
MKKRGLLTIVTIFAVSVLFTSCKDDEVIPPMLGYWKCTGIGANVLGTSTSTIGEDVLKYFSVGYAGVGTSGGYVRVGVDDVTSLTSLGSGISADTWKKFLSAGTYTYDASAGTITHTSSGESKTYNYAVNGNTLKLTEQTINVSSSSTVNSALDILNSLLGTSATTSVGVEYTYEKLSEEDFKSLISKK